MPGTLAWRAAASGPLARPGASSNRDPEWWTLPRFGRRSLRTDRVRARPRSRTSWNCEESKAGLPGRQGPREWTGPSEFRKALRRSSKTPRHPFDTHRSLKRDGTTRAPPARSFRLSLKRTARTAFLLKWYADLNSSWPNLRYSTFTSKLIESAYSLRGRGAHVSLDHHFRIDIGVRGRGNPRRAES